MSNKIGLDIQGFVKIYDPVTNEIFVDKKNAINYENMSEALARTICNRGFGTIYQMAFGNGAASIDQTGLITYLPPNTEISNASLYNQTYAKIVDDTLISNTDSSRNKLTITHVTGKVYTDIIVQCVLDYGEPDSQGAFDNSTQASGDFTFNEIGLLANWGTDDNGVVIPKLLTHVIFHPVQKSLNRQIQIDYTVRIQAITNMVTL